MASFYTYQKKKEEFVVNLSVPRFHEQPISEPKVKAYIPMYEPLEVVKCKECKSKSCS
jgi:hypothetical protein